MHNDCLTTSIVSFVSDKELKQHMHDEHAADGESAQNVEVLGDDKLPTRILSQEPAADLGRFQEKGDLEDKM